VALTYLVDTSVYTRLGVEAIARRVRELDAEGLARPAITDLEIGFSARSASEWDRLLEALTAFERVDIEPHHFERAKSVQRLLADRGLRGRKVPDLLIAAVAESTGRCVLHYDADFDHIAAVTGQPTEWVVPRDSID